MRQTEIIMGMPVTLEIIDSQATHASLTKIFDYFRAIDARFSTYKPESEIMQINRGELMLENASPDMQLIFRLAEETKDATHGYFSIGDTGRYDPSGIVKGWAINEAAKQLLQAGFTNFYVEAGGDVQVHGHNSDDKPWRLGIRNPFNTQETVKVLELTNKGVATSGTYERGAHIYNPVDDKTVTEIVSLTVIGPDIYGADRFATGAFAMGEKGIEFLEQLDDFEAYMIDQAGIATMTSGFANYTGA